MAHPIPPRPGLRLADAPPDSDPSYSDPVLVRVTLEDKVDAVLEGQRNGD